MIRIIRYRTRLMLYLALWTLIAAPALAADAPNLTNGALRLAFDATHGQLTTLESAAPAHEFLAPDTPLTGLWEIRFLSPDAVPLTPEQAKSFSWRPVEGTEPALELIWQDFGIPQAPDLRVCVEVTLVTGEPMSRWSIRLERLGDTSVAAVSFPRLQGIAPQERETLAVPVWMGERTARIRELLGAKEGGSRRFEWEYPGLLSLQCLAFYRENGPGLYLASDDTAAYRKHFAVTGAGGAGLEIVHFPEQTAAHAKDFTLPYHVLAGVFEGDWITAAERYRGWALSQPWANNSRLRLGQVPGWVTDTGLWVWNRGRSENVLTPALALQEQAHLPVSVFWHWWHGCSYDTGFPEYLPPREGEAPFRAALTAAHEKGLHAMVYMNQRLWGMTTRSWAEEGAERYAVKDMNGKVHPEVYNTFTKAPCASMCMGTAFWRDKYAGLAEAAWKSLGVDGVYMDQACSSLACYDPAHGHPIGGGRYWMQGFQSLSADIRARCAAPRPIVLAGEGCGEAWLPYLDLMLSLQVSMERYMNPGEWEPIPFFHAVYHGYAVFYGNYSSLTMPPYDDLWPAEFAPKEPLRLLDRAFSTQFRMEQARAFVWGQQPTVANFLPNQLTERKEEIDFVIRLARVRQQALKYLLHGAFLRPPDFAAASATLDMSRLSIYAGQQGGLQTFQKSYPLVLAGAWRAADGDAALALANISESAQPVDMPIPVKAWGLPATGNVFRIGASGRHEMGTFQNGAARIQETLPPQEVCLYEFTRP